MDQTLSGHVEAKEGQGDPLALVRLLLSHLRTDGFSRRFKLVACSSWWNGWVLYGVEVNTCTTLGQWKIQVTVIESRWREA